MKRVIRTAVAVTAFGLAAALAAPASAASPESGSADGPGLGHMVGGAVHEALGIPKAARTKYPKRPGSAPTSRTRPDKPGRSGPARDTAIQDRWARDLGPDSLGQALGMMSTTAVMPSGGALPARDSLRGLSQAAKKALPSQDSNGRLGPLVGHLTPSEAAPMLESLPGTTQVASVDEIAPLVEDASALAAANGTKAAGSYTDTVASLGWSTAALTSAVRDPWHHH